MGTTYTAVLPVLISARSYGVLPGASTTTAAIETAPRGMLDVAPYGEVA